ncbi:MAG: DNA-binding protein [Candidatus Micrarchaeota archaeon]
MPDDQAENDQDESYQNAIRKRQEDAQRQQSQELQLKNMLKQILDPAGYGRLQNIRLTNLELYYKVAQLLVTLQQQGKLKGKVDEAMLKNLLSRLIANRRETKISFTRK